MDGSPEQVQDLKRGNHVARKQALLEGFTTVATIPPPGISAIKQVELYSKFRDLLPQKYQDITCPYPGDAIMLKIKKEKNEKVLKKARTMKIMEIDVDGTEIDADGKGAGGKSADGRK